MAAALVVQLITWPIVGALLWRALRREVSPVALIVVVLLAAYAATTLPESSSAWWSATLIAVANGSLVLLFGLYPDGRFTPRWIVIPVGLGVAIQAVNVAMGFALELQAWWPSHILAVWAVTLIGGQLYRYRRRSSIAERERVRWPLLATLAMIFGFTAWAMTTVGLGLDSGSGSALAILLLVAPGVGFAVGLLTPRIIDVDVALWWCLAIGCTAITLAAAILSITALGRALGVEAEGRAWMTGVAVAGLALPAVRFYRTLANRIVFGRRASPLQAVDELAQRLSQTSDPRRVPDTIVRVVMDMVGVAGARLLVEDVVHAEAGRAFLEERFPITHHGRPIATLAVSPRAGETGLRGIDRAIVARLAAQAGPALHGAGVVFELAEARARVVIAREDERRRLRWDLHDDLAPTLAALGIEASLVATEAHGTEGRVVDRARDLADHLNAASRHVRELAYELRPPALDDRGLVSAITDHVAASAGPPRVRVSAPMHRLELPAAVEACALRIVQEAVTNVRRHAAATSCVVTIDPRPDGLTIEVVDDGIGLPIGRAPGVGIQSMAERAAEIGGAFEISSQAGVGTRVLVSLPVPR